jgi:CheY-like chemotaxis protein
MKVLIADDEAEQRAILSELFQRHGLETFEARNGLECLLQVKRERPDVVVLDLIMPRVNGIEALKRIRKIDPHTRVVVLTASTYSNLHQTARTLGATEVYTKPCDFEQFARHIARLASGGGSASGGTV